MSETKFNENQLMQIYIETNREVCEYVFENESHIHDSRNIKQIFEAIAKKIIKEKLLKADPNFEERTEIEKKEIIEQNFKGVEKAMVQTLRSKNTNEYGFK